MTRRVLAAVLLAAACGDDGGGGGSDGADSAADDFAPPTTNAGDATDPSGAATTTSASAGSGDATGGGGGSCSSTADCAADEMCRWADDSCGASGLGGTCIPRAGNCDNGDGRPVCGCDGTVYDTLCNARTAGMDVNFLGGCATPAGAFDCGYSYCIGGEEYCQQDGGPMPTFACVELPPVCQPPDCSCITTCCGCDNATCCSEFCSNDNGALTYTCPG